MGNRRRCSHWLKMARPRCPLPIWATKILQIIAQATQVGNDGWQPPIAHCLHMHPWATLGSKKIAHCPWMQPLGNTWAMGDRRQKIEFMCMQPTAQSPLPIAQKMQAWWYGAIGRRQRFLLNINIANMSLCQLPIVSLSSRRSHCRIWHGDRGFWAFWRMGEGQARKKWHFWCGIGQHSMIFITFQKSNFHFFPQISLKIYAFSSLKAKLCTKKALYKLF